MPQSVRIVAVLSHVVIFLGHKYTSVANVIIDNKSYEKCYFAWRRGCEARLKRTLEIEGGG